MAISQVRQKAVQESKGVETVPSPINRPSTKYLFAAIAVNLILEPIKPPVVALPAPASPFKFTFISPGPWVNILLSILNCTCKYELSKSSKAKILLENSAGEGSALFKIEIMKEVYDKLSPDALEGVGFVIPDTL